MPLIKIDYNEKILDKSTINLLIEKLRQESMEIYNAGEDKVSVFTSSFGDHFFSKFAAEIEIRANKKRYETPDKKPDEIRKEHVTKYSILLNEFIEEFKIKEGFVFTITFEDWQVAWLPGAK